MIKRFCLILCLLVIAAIALPAIGCETSSATAVPHDHLILTISFDDDPDGYYTGEQVDTYFLQGYEFRLSDVYGTFYGDYKWLPDKNELILDFYDYSTWRLTLNPDGSFDGSEAGYANGGTYHWQ